VLFLDVIKSSWRDLDLVVLAFGDDASILILFTKDFGLSTLEFSDAIRSSFFLNNRNIAFVLV
jgi:hypothetical protein